MLSILRGFGGVENDANNDLNKSVRIVFSPWRESKNEGSEASQKTNKHRWRNVFANILAKSRLTGGKMNQPGVQLGSQRANFLPGPTPKPRNLAAYPMELGQFSNLDLTPPCLGRVRTLPRKGKGTATTEITTTTIKTSEEHQQQEQSQQQ